MQAVQHSGCRMRSTAQTAHQCPPRDGDPRAERHGTGFGSFHHFHYFPIKSPAENWLSKLHTLPCLASVVGETVDRLHRSTAGAAELVSDKIKCVVLSEGRAGESTVSAMEKRWRHHPGVRETETKWAP